MEELQNDVLADIITDSQLIQANGWKRFANFLIDYAGFFVFAACIGIVWALISPETVSMIGNDRNDFGDTIIERLISMFLYAFYIGSVEAICKGSSLGKLITGTKAVNEDGSNIAVGTAFKRGLSRIVPFEIFSAFGSPSYPWHDRWNRTYVIDIRKSSVLSNPS